MDIKRKDGESLKDFKIRICENKQALNISWQEVADIINKESGENWSESTYRKWWSAFDQGRQYAIEQMSSDDILEDIKNKTLELQKERIKLQTEKLEYNKMIREQSRSELFEEKVLKAVENRKPIQVPTIIIKQNNSKRDFLFPIADMHYGVEFEVKGLRGEILNKYSPEIFEKRMWDLLQEFVSINDAEKINHVNLVNLSDSIDGILRMSQLQSLRLGVVDSVIQFSDFMETWLNELSKYCVVDYYSVQGNHNEIRHLSAKRGDFPHENTERLITKILEKSLSNNKNITIHNNENICLFEVLGINILAVHGQNERNLEQSIKDYTILYNQKIDMLLSGHLHTDHNKTIGMTANGNIEFIQCPSICGSDEFSMSIKKTAKPGAKIIQLEQDRKRKITYDIILS
jgi:predicted phosphodiesterase/ribosomal protein L29